MRVHTRFMGGLITEVGFKANDQLTKDHSTSDLPFQMDADFDNMHPPRNQFVHRFRATTEPPGNNHQSPARRMSGTPVHQRNGHTTHSNSGLTPRPSNDDLESSTQTLKNLLSIKSIPSNPSTESRYTSDGPPSPSPIRHHRTQSAAQPSHRPYTPTNSSSQTPRRVVSSSGVP